MAPASLPLKGGPLASTPPPTAPRAAGSAAAFWIAPFCSSLRKDAALAERGRPPPYLKDGENLVVVASNGGTASHPGWWVNLTASPEADVEVSRKKIKVRAEEVEGEEKRRLWTRLVEMYPPYADYQRKTDREIPVVVLRPAGRREKEPG